MTFFIGEGLSHSHLLCISHPSKLRECNERLEKVRMNDKPSQVSSWNMKAFPLVEIPAMMDNELGAPRKIANPTARKAHMFQHMIHEGLPSIITSE